MGSAMGHHYTQLNLDERIEIYHLFANGKSFRQIAAAINRAPSTIARELRRNATQSKQTDIRVVIGHNAPTNSR